MADTKEIKKTEKKTVATKKMSKESADLLVSKAVRTILANKRQSPAKTLKRGEVRGGGRKPWRQKGTGRARAGSTRSPIWRGGGITFGPTGNENYSLGINKKEMRAAKAAALELKKADTYELTIGPIKKTKEASDFLKNNNISGKTLLLIAGAKDEYESLKKPFRNIKDLKVKFSGNENIHDILAAQKIVLLKIKKTKAATEIKPKDKK
ncbi:50S ribosomal protein L4 [Patescibacteria group bacterium]|nr:50S ribosomal protein L4 [Patescibacteria group bacterium]